MAKVFMFVYALIIFISPFLLATFRSMSFFLAFSNFPFQLKHTSPFNNNIFLFFFNNTARLPCEKDDDCPEAFLPPVMKCVNRFCQYEILE